MQLEDTASSKDVPPLSPRGVLELPEFVAQKNMRPAGQSTIPCALFGYVLLARAVMRSLVC
jgi:hypothetical protein